MRQLDPQMVLQFVDVFWNFGVDAFNFSTRFRAVHCPRKTQRLPQSWHCRKTWAPWPTILTCSFLINIRQVAHSFPATASRERSVRHPAEVLRQHWRGVDVLWCVICRFFFVIDSSSSHTEEMFSGWFITVFQWFLLTPKPPTQALFLNWSSVSPEHQKWGGKVVWRMVYTLVQSQMNHFSVQILRWCGSSRAPLISSVI